MHTIRVKKLDGIDYFRSNFVPINLSQKVAECLMESLG